MLEIVLVKEAAEGDEENWIREEAGDGDSKVALEVINGSKYGLTDVWPRGGDGSPVEADEVLVSDASHEVGGQALEDCHGWDGLEPCILEA